MTTTKTKEEALISEEGKKALELALKEIGQANNSIVTPMVGAEEAIKAWDSYLELKKAIIKPDDIQQIQGKIFLKKSYWRKIATFFNLSVDIVSERKEALEDGNVTYHFVCKATAPNGRFAIGAGSCDVNEKGRANSIHNTRSTAETRAWNRAVSNLVGGGEVSAEEVDGYFGKPKASVKPIKMKYETISYTKAEKIDQADCKENHEILPELEVKKPGPNQGRKFKACKTCDYFKWVK